MGLDDGKDYVVCPRCGARYLRYLAALSRRDNKTSICSTCGTAEAFEDFTGKPYRGKPYWKVK